MGGYPPRMNGNGYGPRGPPQQMQRRPSLEENDLGEFSHLMLYDNLPEGQVAQMADGGYDMPGGPDIALRERELALRQKEIALREQEFNMRRRGPGPGPRMPPPPASHAGWDDDEEDGEDFFDPNMMPHGGPPVDPDQVDMMSVTSRRTRKAPSAANFAITQKSRAVVHLACDRAVALSSDLVRRTVLATKSWVICRTCGKS